LLIIVAGLGIALGWLGLSALRRHHDERTAVAHIARCGGYMELDYYPQAGGKGQSELMRVVRRWLGADFMTHVAVVGLSPIVNADTYKMHVPKCSNDDLSIVAKLPRLRSLGLSNTPITDQGIANLSKATRLESIWLHGTSITDRSLEYLARHRQLKNMSLHGTKITDDGLPALYSMHQLETVSLSDRGGVTLKGVHALKAALPRCKITWFTGDEMVHF
jgi:hypothetical protein